MAEPAADHMSRTPSSQDTDGVDTRLSAAGPASGLAPREYQALRLVALGLESKEAADVMGITCSTAKGYLTRAYKKLGAETRTQAFLYLGWLQVPPP